MTTNATQSAADEAAVAALLADLGGPAILPPAEEIIDDGKPLLEEPKLEAAAGSTEIIEENGAPATTEPEDKAALQAKVKANREAERAKKAAESAAAKAAKAELQAAAKKAKAEAAAAAKAKKAEEKTAAEAAKPPAEPKEAKKPKEPRIHFSNKTDRIKHRLGDKLNDYLVLETADAALTDEVLAAKQAETLATIDGMNVKVKNRASLLLDYVAGKTDKLNRVIQTAFKVLCKDGNLVTGDKGNLHIELLKKPYSPAAARAMGRNTIVLMTKLKVVVETKKGEYAANPNSLVLANVKQMLAL